MEADQVAETELFQSRCPDCGVWFDGEIYYEAFPSDCHSQGGHYVSCYDAEGKFRYTTVPWQIHPSEMPLTQDQMALARQEYAEFQAKIVGC